MAPDGVSVIIGASRGIGRALGRGLARRGGSVVAVARDPHRLTETIAELRESGPEGDHCSFAGDVSSAVDMQRLASVCAERYGAVDLLVISAAVAGYEGDQTRLPPATRDLPLTAWQRAIDVNLHGPFLASRAFLPMMTARGEGDILNICSSTTPHGLRGTALAPGYSATKFAVAAFTRVLAEEAAEFGVRVNAVFPGPVEAPLIDGTMLARPFGGAISADNFAEAIIRLLQLGGSMVPLEPHVLPMPLRRRAGAVRDAR
jgi:3-oxoacyl-[acyl-carrier protein] reductase